MSARRHSTSPRPTLRGGAAIGLAALALGAAPAAAPAATIPFGAPPGNLSQSFEGSLVLATHQAALGHTITATITDVAGIGTSTITLTPIGAPVPGSSTACDGAPLTVNPLAVTRFMCTWRMTAPATTTVIQTVNGVSSTVHPWATAQATFCGDYGCDVYQDYYGVPPGTGLEVSGRVAIGCDCQSGDSLEGVAVTLRGAHRSVHALSGPDGMFHAFVPRGSYTLSDQAAGMKFTPASRRLTVRRKTSAAKERGCMITTAPHGIYHGGNCENAIVVNWRPARRALSFGWRAVVTCGANDVFHSTIAALAVNQPVVGGHRGQTLSTNGGAVSFLSPIAAPGSSLSGTLAPNGTGHATATLDDGGCTARASLDLRGG
jgi:hypothetical protein